MAKKKIKKNELIENPSFDNDTNGWMAAKGWDKGTLHVAKTKPSKPYTIENFILKYTKTGIQITFDTSRKLKLQEVRNTVIMVAHQLL